MKVLITKEYNNKDEFGHYPLGHICEVSRPIGKFLIKNGFAVEDLDGVTNQDRFVIESRPPEQPQVIIMPFPVSDEEE